MMKYHDEHPYIAQLSIRFPHAIIDMPVEIGVDTQIWHYTHVMAGAKIGDRCTLGQGVHVASNVTVGNGCKIQNGVQLFTGVTLEDDVFVGPCAVFTNVKTPRAFEDRKAEFQPTLVRTGASIGANATIVCGVTIGEYAMVGAGAVVTRDVPMHALVVGNPAEHRHAWVCTCGARLTIGRLTTIFDPCRECASRYELVVGGLKKL